MSDGFEGAANMVGTGIGLGIMTMGAMVPLIIMKNMLDDKGSHKTKKGLKVNVPKVNINVKVPPVKVNKIKVK